MVGFVWKFLKCTQTKVSQNQGLPFRHPYEDQGPFGDVRAEILTNFQP